MKKKMMKFNKIKKQKKAKKNNRKNKMDPNSNFKKLICKVLTHNLFDNQQAGIEWVNNTFYSLKDESGTIQRVKIKAISISLGAP